MNATPDNRQEYFMNKHDEQKLRLILKEELTKNSSYEPAVSQDAIFQESLEQHLSEKPSTMTSNRFYWSVAASIIFLIGIVATFSTNYSEDSSVYQRGLPELIAASNQIEQQLASFEADSLPSAQYVEVFKLRGEISYLDNTLNELYSLGQQVSEKELEILWQRRLKATQDLKALYTNKYRIVRI